MYISILDKRNKVSEDVYDVVSDELYEMKKLGIVEDHVEPTDIYFDEFGNVYYVSFYDMDFTREEGHGFHDVSTNYGPSTYNQFLKNWEIIDRVNNI